MERLVSLTEELLRKITEKRYSKPNIVVDIETFLKAGNPWHDKVGSDKWLIDREKFRSDLSSLQALLAEVNWIPWNFFAHPCLGGA
jgi:hypothetical protein